MTPEQARQALAEADLINPASEIDDTLNRLADEITTRLSESVPLVLPVMGGAAIFAGHLLTRLTFPLDFDYLHVTRYRESTRGGQMEWKVLPGKKVEGRTVLVLDDILDEGETLHAVVGKLRELGAAAVWTAVLADKAIAKPKPMHADFTGFSVPDRYVFGFGMDLHGWWRNLPAIYALKP